MKQTQKLEQIIKYAAKAPSGHNTQPWKFKIEDNSIAILPDFTRALPVVDSDNHALYISLGCALENLLIAAHHFGFNTQTTIHNGNKFSFIQINLAVAETKRHHALFDCITKRQVTRNQYSKDKIQDDKLNALFGDIAEKGVRIKKFVEKKEIEQLIPFIIEGSNRQFKNKQFKKELVSWIRFNKKAVQQTGDGLWASSMGFPNIPRWFGYFVMMFLTSAQSEAKRWKKLIEQSAGFALFSVEKNDAKHWIKLGQTFQRFRLKATQLNICHSHANMPCEEEAVRKKLVNHFGLTGQTLLLLVRFGYSELLPYSYRRNLHDILIKS